MNGARSPILRNLSLWRHFCNYFPLALERTAELPPDRKYVFGYHPHGIMSFGAIGNFCTNGNEFSKLFPGLDLRLLTLPLNFFTPFVRELLLHLGLCSASRAACHRLLQRGSGSAIMLVIGGAEESLNAQPGTNDLVLDDRLGFIRVALINRASMVPVFAFGENDIFETLRDKDDTGWLRRVQLWLLAKLTFAIPIFHGRGLFNLDFGLMPFRRPIVTVVGEPLEPATEAELPDENATDDYLRNHPAGQEIVERYHQKYKTKLVALYDAHKNRLALSRTRSVRVQ